LATMVIENPKPVELEAWREELRVLLDSRAFRQAPTLARLLEYLCEKRFAGESNQIKEYSIGVEVFRRGAAFDQETGHVPAHESRGAGDERWFHCVTRNYPMLG